MTTRPMARADAREWSARAMTEKQWQAFVIEFAQLHGWIAFHQFDSRRGEPGWPDLALIRPGELVFAELKREGGRLTVQQACVLGLLHEAGQECHIWYPHDEAEVRERLGRDKLSIGRLTGHATPSGDRARARANASTSVRPSDDEGVRRPVVQS